MIKRKYVPLRIVQPGMMIDQAIIDRAGRVLIARRTRLEDFHIDALKCAEENGSHRHLYL